MKYKFLSVVMWTLAVVMVVVNVRKGNILFTCVWGFFAAIDTFHLFDAFKDIFKGGKRE